MGKVKSTLVICLTALPLLINAPAAQAEEGFNLERQLRQLMQLDSKTVRKIRPLISRYQRCLGKQQALLEIQNKVREMYNHLTITNNQITVSTSTVRNYLGLLQGERQKFNAGESSVFLINSRENNYINSRLKLIDFMTKYKIYDSGIYWSLGILHEK